MNIFDAYDLRARICVNAAFMMPFILDIFLLRPKSLSVIDGVILTAICIVFCQILLSTCIREKCRTNRNMAAELLTSGNGLTAGTRTRYYRKLAQLEEGFQPLLNYMESTSASESADLAGLSADAVTWLRAKSRDKERFHLVHEENINYGFLRNMLMQRSIGILCNTFAALFWGCCLLYEFGIAGAILHGSCVWCLAIHLAAVFYYTACVSEDTVNTAAKRYAYALLEVLDIL